MEQRASSDVICLNNVKNCWEHSLVFFLSSLHSVELFQVQVQHLQKTENWCRMFNLSKNENTNVYVAHVELTLRLLV